MMDFLKSYPFLTVEDYYWNYSYIMIQLMIRDATKVYYLSEAQYKEYKRNQMLANAQVVATNDIDAFEKAFDVITI